MNENKVIIIEPTKREGSIERNLDNNRKLRVAAYARVSTGSEEQATSFDNQVDEWTKRITSNPNYEFVKVYTDEGISGTSDKKRIGFQEMIADAKAGKIDLILCKSISRFARNAVLIQQTLRELKMLGVEVKFDNENLSSTDPKSEVLFSIMSSLAQEESRHISENVSWTLQKKMNEGIPIVNTTKFLGYDKSEDGKKLVINEAEAQIVRKIFDLYDAGNGVYRIARILREGGYKTVTGSSNWWGTTISGILKNEKYVGDLLQQKTYTADYLGHIRKDNTGQRKMYFLENCHEPIISREQWNRAQAKLKAQKDKSIGCNPDLSKYNNRYPLSGMLICVNCGGKYKRRLWNSKAPCSKNIYQCTTYISNSLTGVGCHSKALRESLAIDACCDVINKIYMSKTNAFSKLSTVIKSTFSNNRLGTEEQKKKDLKDKLNKEIDELLKERYFVTSQELKNKYDKKYFQLVNQYQTLEKEINNLSEQKINVLDSQDRIKKMLNLLKAKQITPEILNNEMVATFFHTIFVTGQNELVFVINASRTMSNDEIIERRKEIVKRDSIYENQFRKRDPYKYVTMKYKVVVI